MGVRSPDLDSGIQTSVRLGVKSPDFYFRLGVKSLDLGVWGVQSFDLRSRLGSLEPALVSTLGESRLSSFYLAVWSPNLESEV